MFVLIWSKTRIYVFFKIKPLINKDIVYIQATYLKIERQSPLIAPRREAIVFKANWTIKSYYYYYYH